MTSYKVHITVQWCMTHKRSIFYLSGAHKMEEPSPNKPFLRASHQNRTIDTCGAISVSQSRKYVPSYILQFFYDSNTKRQIHHRGKEDRKKTESSQRHWTNQQEKSYFVVAQLQLILSTHSQVFGYIRFQQKVNKQWFRYHNQTLRGKC